MLTDHTDHTDLPDELKSPSRQFQAASDSVGLYWWQWDHISQKIKLSGALEKILGLTPGKEYYAPEELYPNIHPDDVQHNSVLLHQLYTGIDELYEIEYRIKDSTGKWKWYYNRGSVIQKAEEGVPEVIGGITMDISSQFKRLLSMVEDKEKFEFIVRNTNEAIIIIELLEGKAGTIMDANKAALDLFKKGPEVFGGPLPEYILQDNIIGREGPLMKDVFEKGFGRREQMVKLEDGEELWLEFNLHAFTLTGENLMIAIVKDKTSRKRAEAALRESEKLYQTVVEAAEDRIGLITPDGKPILMNSAYYETVGYSREEFLQFGQYDLIHPDDKKMLQEESRMLFKQGFSSHEYRIRHKDGYYLDMSSKLVLIKGEGGESDLVLFITRDITERKRTMKELEEAKEHAVESDQLKSAFLANMSHEIRTPMNSIIGFSNLLNKAGLEDEVRELYVRRIISNSELLLTLISDIIDLAKIESGQLPIIIGKQKITDLFSEMEQYARDEMVRLNKEHIQLEIELKCKNFEIETDVLRLAQVMKNLINNAIKFTEKGSVQIGCLEGESERTVRFYVKDTGIGISTKHFNVIFDQFRQVDGSNTRKYGGTGLGLAICKQLIELMGGSIWVESETGSGAFFQVELPLKMDWKGEHHLAQETKQKGSGKKVQGLSILAVDDEPDTLELFDALLTEMGHHVNVATTGYEALRMLEQLPLPDLVLMDIQMPVMSGTDTLGIIRERYPDLKVVAQSAHALTGDRKRFLEEGYDDYLPKPFTNAQIEMIISNLSSG